MKSTYLNRIGNECVKLLKETKIPIHGSLVFSVNSRLSRTLGRCKKLWNGFEIEIQSYILENANTDGLKGVIIHELLHTCPECFNHGKTWKKYARIINEKYGFDISRTTCLEDIGINEGKFQKERMHGGGYKYIVACTKCGCRHHYKRAGKVVKHPDWYRCGKCKGELKRVHGKN